jgi:protein tyrosine phosphatase (PTP) superfamily phosphohydrolase (DUF442 family)
MKEPKRPMALDDTVRMAKMNRLFLFLMFAVAHLVAGCQRNSRPTEDSSKPSSDSSTKIEKNGLHNVYRINDKLFSGSSPEGEEGFRSLKELGIQTIISVDGAKPEVALAHKFGLRYVHLPIGYDGISRPQTLRLAKAVRDFPGPVYIHCHHGKHRGPAAAAAIHLCLDEKCSVEQAVAQMKQAGTDPHYNGLYELPRTLVRPTKDELDTVRAEFPEVAEVSGLAQLMVEIDTRWDNLKTIQASGWMPPKNNPDLDPPHEALMLAEHYREAGRLPKVKERPAQFREMLTNAEEEAVRLEKTLRIAKQTGKMDRPGADEAFQRTKASCVQCHDKYRDVSQGNR